MTSDLGRTIIVLQGAVDSLGFKDDDEREAYLAHYRDKLRELMRQDLLTFRANCATAGDVQRAQEIDQAKRGAQAT